VPLALYVDWKNLYKRRATPKERLRGEEQISQFERMCAKLGIELTAANSPQAKGRVRKNPRDASRSAGEEIAAKRNHESRASERVPGASICRNTIGGLSGRQPSQGIITGEHRGRPHWIGFSDWKARARSTTIGWCGMTTGFSNSSGRPDITHRLTAR